jgi:hypothetical protein
MRCALYPKPYLFNRTRVTLHPKSYTLNPKPYTLHPKPYTLHPVKIHGATLPKEKKGSQMSRTNFHDLFARGGQAGSRAASISLEAPREIPVCALCRARLTTAPPAPACPLFIAAVAPTWGMLIG